MAEGDSSHNNPAEADGAAGNSAGNDDKPKKPTNKERLTEEIKKRVDQSKELQQQSIDLHKQADEAEDDSVAADLHHQAAQLDKKAATLLKTARRLEKGWVQGVPLAGNRRRGRGRAGHRHRLRGWRHRGGANDWAGHTGRCRDGARPWAVGQVYREFHKGRRE
ncbi:hypothetical protein MN608_07338 [Microdochium nivale]|nr:hypothetical protein MN608_07338 [Microdochium nivale]